MIDRVEGLRLIFTAALAIFLIGEGLWYIRQVAPWRDVKKNPEAYTEPERFLSELQCKSITCGVVVALPIATYFVFK